MEVLAKSFLEIDSIANHDIDELNYERLLEGLKLFQNAITQLLMRTNYERGYD